MIINVNEIVIAVNGNDIIGYYLTCSAFETETIKKRKLIVDDLIKKAEIEDVRYSLLTQGVVDLPYMGQGIAKELLKHLKYLVRNKFDYLIGYIDAENIDAKAAHLKSGWVIFAEMSNGCLAMKEVKKPGI